MPKISIIVPVYNVEKYIAKCIHALQAQTFRDIEIICVDDRGNDASMDILREIARGDKRIKIIQNTKNSGIAQTRNVGLGAAGAPYVMWCDSDDWYAPQMCEMMYNAITSTGADIAVCGVNTIYEADVHCRQSDAQAFFIPRAETRLVSPEIVNSSSVSLWNKIFRRDIITENQITFPPNLHYEDDFFFRAYMCHAKTITYVPTRLYNYRRNAGSIMNKTFNQTGGYSTDCLKIAMAFYEYLAQHNMLDGKYDEYWQTVFIPYFKLALARAPNPDIASGAAMMARDFARDKYTHPSADFWTNRAIRLITESKMRIPRIMQRSFIRHICDEYKTEYAIGPISVFKIKYTPTRTTYHLFGIPFIIKRHRS